MATTRRLLLAALLIALSGCAWDGPSADVRVVPPSMAPHGDPIDDNDAVVGAAGVAEVPASGELSADGLADPPAGEVLVPPLPYDFPKLPRVVGVVGDSLMVSAQDELVVELRQLGIDSVVNARESRRMTAGSAELPSGASAIEEVRSETTPDLWVIELGTNDVGAQAGPERFRDDIGELLALIPRDAPLVWVDIWIRDRDVDAAAANRMLRSELSNRRAPTAIVDWHARGEDEGVVTGDGVHLTDLGQQKYAEAIAMQIIALSTR